jgi:hypothetical protein
VVFLSRESLAPCSRYEETGWGFALKYQYFREGQKMKEKQDELRETTPYSVETWSEARRTRGEKARVRAAVVPEIPMSV